MVQGHPTLFTAETGASKTIISKRMYEAMDRADRPALTKSSRLLGPSGAVIMELGKAKFSLTSARQRRTNDTGRSEKQIAQSYCCRPFYHSTTIRIGDRRLCRKR